MREIAKGSLLPWCNLPLQPTCLFIIMSEDLCEMKQVFQSIQQSILLALCLCSLINITEAEVAAGAIDVIAVGNHIANISIYHLQQVSMHINRNLTFCSHIWSLLYGTRFNKRIAFKGSWNRLGKSGSIVPHERLITAWKVLLQSDYQPEMRETIGVVEKEEAVKTKDIHEIEEVVGTAFSN